MSTLVQSWRAALADPAAVEGARKAYTLFHGMCAEPQPRMPGMGTLDRLAVRIHGGMTPEQAAAREYLYRWGVVMLAWINFAETDRPRCRHSGRRMTGAWSLPHLIGM